MTLFQAADLLQHTHIDILKLNIEGSEFVSVLDFLHDERFSSLQVSQIMMEIHYVESWGIKMRVHIIVVIKPDMYRIWLIYLMH